jgi:hypothetical protein
MKKIILALLLCLIGGNVLLFAQDGGSRDDEGRRVAFEKFRIEREQFISKEMGLTEKETAVFWPISNELQKKKFELNKDLREQIRALHTAKRDGKTVSNANYKKILEIGSKIKIREAELDEEYLKKFLEVLPAEKVYKYQYADQEFGKRMMHRREQGRPQ